MSIPAAIPEHGHFASIVVRCPSYHSSDLVLLLRYNNFYSLPEVEFHQPLRECPSDQL